MRGLTSNERTLAFLLGGLMVFVLIVFGLKWCLGESRRLNSEIARLEVIRKSLEEMIQEKPYWVARQEWIQEHPAEPYRVADSESRFVEEVQKGMNDGGLSIEKQELHESEKEDSLVETIVDVDGRGSLEKIVRWLQGIQQPGRYVAIKSLTLKQVDESAAMLARVRLAKVYREDAGP